MKMNWFKNFGLGIFLLLGAPSLSHAQRSIDPALQEVIESIWGGFIFPSINSTGMGLSIVMNDGELLYSNGVGMADVERSVPALNSTQYTIGSISKSFTGVLALKVLHERYPHLEENVLDTPIRKLLPEVNFTLSDRFRSEFVTFRDLLSHQTCVEDNAMHVLSGQLNSTDELVYRSRYNGEQCKLRTAFSYNNQMITLAGELAGKVANKTYEEAMQELWNELGMANTAFVKMTDDYSQMPQRAMPYYFKDDEYHPMNTNLTKRAAVSPSAVGINTTPDDMVKFMRLLINFGEVGGKQIIPRKAMEWLTKPSFWTGMSPVVYRMEDEEQLPLWSQLYYSLGLQITTLDGWQLMEHGGIAPPFTAMMVVSPEKKLGMFTATNTGPTHVELHFALQVFLFNMLRGGDSKEKSLEKGMALAEKIRRELDLKRKLDNAVVRKEFEKRLEKIGTKGANGVEFVGKYGSGALGEIEISERFNDELDKNMYYMEYGVWFRGWLHPVEKEEDVYNISWDTDVVQDIYAYPIMDEEDLRFVLVHEDDTIHFYGMEGARGTFQRGVSLDNLPVIPWEPSSC